MAGRLDGKVAVITGGTSGIGAATAHRFVAEGAHVLIAGRSTDKGQALADELGANALFQRADVRNEADISALVDTAALRFGRLDCFFNNAGAPAPGTLETVTEPDLDYIANAALFLASDEGSFINCHDLVVDGGRIGFFFEKPRQD